MIAALVMQPNIVVAVAPATYTTAMIGKSCSEFIDVGLHLHMSSNYCTLTFGRVTQGLPVIYMQQQCCRAAMAVL